MTRFVLGIIFLVIACHVVFAQQTNPVDRKVANPMTDTPNVNPLNTDQPVQRPRRTQGGVQGVATDEIKVAAAKENGSGPEDAGVVVYEGNVDIRIGTYRLQADKVTVYTAENRAVAEGNVVFDQADQQRITGSRGERDNSPQTSVFVDPHAS